jgi:DMSO/TMAO reductase YedYZ molybdopterin-dependent catalytic subunit
MSRSIGQRSTWSAGQTALPSRAPARARVLREIELFEAVQPEVLIVYQMNGRDLGRDHGYPVRAIVPGHYGMASVKWLTCIQAVREPFQGYWQTSDYRLLGLSRWQACAARDGRNEAEVRHRPATGL